jgi:transposase InsO family protein
VWVPPSTPADQEVLVPHANAPFTPEGRRRLCERIDAGRPIAHVAAEAGISRQCLSKWYRRWCQEGPSGLWDRSSQPLGSPRRTSAALTEQIRQLRVTGKFGPARIAYELARRGVQIAASTVHRVLVRLGLSRLRDLDRPTGLPARLRSYERAAPGELVHIDVKKLGVIRPGGGWWAHGRGSAQDKAAHGAQRVGYDYLHVCIDDHSRLAYAEVLPDETGTTCAAFITRAALFMAGYGITIERVMSDNAFAYRRSAAYADAVASLSPGARRKFIKPHCPWTNGKAERLNQTANDEWARAAVYDSSAERTAALAPWLHQYNHHRPHAALGGLPPVSRVTNVPGCDS